MNKLSDVFELTGGCVLRQQAIQYIERLLLMTGFAVVTTDGRLLYSTSIA